MAQGYNIQFNTEQVDIDAVMSLLQTSYWACNRTKEDMIIAISNSDNIYVYNKEELVGYARVVTDKSTFFWICDVIVKDTYRGQGIGTLLVDYISKLDYFDKSKGLLLTKDAFTLYEKIGFHKEPMKAMVKDRTPKKSTTK